MFGNMMFQHMYPWVTVDFGAEVVVTALAIRKGRTKGWVSSFWLQVEDDAGQLNYITDDQGNPQVT